VTRGDLERLLSGSSDSLAFLRELLGLNARER
jgi:hypothetical protein